MYISANLDQEYRSKLIDLLKEIKDCFAWDYTEMPGLDRSIVEHRLPNKSGYRPYKQPPQKIFKEEVLDDVKKEVERLLEANFIRPCRYAEWILGIVLVYKKATPMDGHPISVADLLVDAAASYELISFMDANGGYNQIFMAIENSSKTAFRCPSHIGLFEWIVMTFGLKNIGATSQRAMNYIFYELIDKIAENYIDDVVVMSWNHEGHLADLRKTLECTRKHGLKMNPNKCAFGVSAGEFLGFLVHK